MQHQEQKQFKAWREKKRNDNGHDSQAFMAHAFMTIIDDCDILSYKA